MKNIIKYIKENKLDKNKAIEYLRLTDLSDSEKNIVFVYCFPRPLRDKELVDRCKKSLYSKTILIIEASQTDQYRRFIQHLIHAFTDSPENLFYEEIPIEDCPICGEKGIIGSSESSILLCEECLKSLIEVRNILDIIEPGFTNWIKRYDK